MTDLVNLAPNQRTDYQSGEWHHAAREVDPLPLSSDTMQIKGQPNDVLRMRLDQLDEEIAKLKVVLNIIANGSLRTHPDLADFLTETAHLRQ